MYDHGIASRGNGNFTWHKQIENVFFLHEFQIYLFIYVFELTCSNVKFNYFTND